MFFLGLFKIGAQALQRVDERWNLQCLASVKLGKCQLLGESGWCYRLSLTVYFKMKEQASWSSHGEKPHMGSTSHSHFRGFFAAHWCLLWGWLRLLPWISSALRIRTLNPAPAVPGVLVSKSFTGFRAQSSGWKKLPHPISCRHVA